MFSKDEQIAQALPLTFSKMTAVLGLMSTLVIGQLSISQVQPTFFGMHVNKLSSLPVSVPISSMRLWDTHTNWFQLCPSSDYSQCEWRQLDKWLAAAKGNGISEVAYTFGKTPDWASSEPEGDCWKATPGVCYPPRDLSSDGGGTDNAFRQFVSAVVEHNRGLDPRTFAKIKFWGIWNEPTAKFFWRGTAAQLVRMAKDAREIVKRADPDALMLTPEPAASARNRATEAAIEFFDDYLGRGGGRYADVIAFHIYANTNSSHPVPEDVVMIIRRIKGQLARHPEVVGRPLWITEGSWGKTDETDWHHEDDATAFLVRYCVLLASEGIQRLYWYGWDVPTGTLSEDGKPLPAANAFREVHDWLVGRSVTNCTSKSHVWSCDLAAPGYRGRIVWNDEYQKTTSYDPRGFLAYRSATGQQGSVDPTTHLFTIRNSPVLFELKPSTISKRHNENGLP